MSAVLRQEMNKCVAILIKRISTLMFHSNLNKDTLRMKLETDILTLFKSDYLTNLSSKHTQFF